MNAPLPHLFTLTGNLLAERTLEFASWQAGRTQRAIRESFQVGGKGINVSKMLHRLGTPNTALCFAGGATGAECEAWLRERGLAHRAFATRAPTRSGTVVRGSAQPETTFLGADAPPDDAALRACAEFLDAQPDGQVLALCGSFPGCTDMGFAPLYAALERWLARGTLVADTYGPMLTWVAARALELVKINSAEFLALDPQRMAISAESLRRITQASPVRQWVVTDGPRNVWLYNRPHEPTSLKPPPVTEVSPTGSGDVLFGCMLHGQHVLGLSLHDAVAFALPYAAANAAHPRVADFPLPAARGH
jgi:1-phosphofructokinase